MKKNQNSCITVRLNNCPISKGIIPENWLVSISKFWWIQPLKKKLAWMTDSLVWLKSSPPTRSTVPIEKELYARIDSKTNKGSVENIHTHSFIHSITIKIIKMPNNKKQNISQKQKNKTAFATLRLIKFPSWFGMVPWNEFASKSNTCKHYLRQLISTTNKSSYHSRNKHHQTQQQK